MSRAFLALLALAVPVVGSAPEAVGPADLLAAINDLRAAAGAPALSPSPALDRVAQARAAELAARGGLPSEADSATVFRTVGNLLGRSGYAAHIWTETANASAGTVEAVLTFWRQDPGFSEAMRPDYRDAGIGTATLQGVPLYLVFLAAPEREFYNRQVAGLHDLGAVRAAMLAAVNRARADAGAPPLIADARLDAAAQAHAEEMLGGVPYGHDGAHGASPRDRALAAGFSADLLAENIAARHVSVDSAMAGWLSSSLHRRNLLDPRLTRFGAGVAVGPWEHRYQVFWVQEIARPGVTP